MFADQDNTQYCSGSRVPDVAVGSGAEKSISSPFTPDRDRCADIADWRLCATTGLMHRSKKYDYSITSSAICWSDAGT